MKRLNGLEVKGLRNVGVWDDGDVGAEVDHCKKYCYSDILCQYWQYGEGGCWVEDPRNSRPIQYPLTIQGGASQVSEFAKTVVDGEFIQHLCPPRSLRSLETSVPAGGRLELRTKSVWRYVPYIIVSVLSALLLFCLSACAWDAREYGRSGKGGPAKSRSVELFSGSESEPENDPEDSLLDDDRPRPPRIERVFPEKSERWTVQVDRSGGRRVGLDLDYGDRRTLLVKRIQAEGLVVKWNAGASPHRRVRVGDRIVAVNGIEGFAKGVKALMDEMRRHKVLNLTVLRDVGISTMPILFGSGQTTALLTQPGSLTNLPAVRRTASEPPGGGAGTPSPLAAAPAKLPPPPAATMRPVRPPQGRGASPLSASVPATLAAPPLPVLTPQGVATPMSGSSASSRQPLLPPQGPPSGRATPVPSPVAQSQAPLAGRPLTLFPGRRSSVG